MITFAWLITLLRLLVGAIFIGHGAQKLFGWFGGPGMQGHRGFLESLGFREASLWAWISALAEFIGGLLILLGLFTPIAAAMAIGAMLVAIVKVHWANGLWNQNGGIEYPLLLGFNAALIGLVGPGPLALNEMLQLQWAQPLVFVVSLLFALLGVALAINASQPDEEPQDRRSPQTS